MSKHSRFIVFLLAVVVVAGTGTVLLTRSLAATSSISAEAESGTRSSTVQLITDSTASNKAAISFKPVSGQCTLSAKLVPSCGVLWGVYTSGAADVRPLETQIGAKFSITHGYHDFSNKGGVGTFPSSLELDYMKDGKTVLLNWDTHLSAGRATGMPAPAGANDVYTYNQITSGALNSYIDIVAGRLKATNKPVFLTFNAEMDDASDLGGSNTLRTAAGTPTQFAAAWRYLHDRLTAAGATNVVWVWLASGFQSSATLYQQLYPGDGYVDWIGWDPYNFYSCGGRTTWKTPADTFNGFYSKIDSGMLGSTAAAKPRMLGEYGSHDDPANSTRNKDWYAAVPSTLQTQFPKIKALIQFNATGTCDTRLTGSGIQAGTLQGFQQASGNPYVRQ